MSRGIIERSYCEEKKQLALQGVEQAQNTAGEVNGLLSSWIYVLPKLIAFSQQLSVPAL